MVQYVGTNGIVRLTKEQLTHWLESVVKVGATAFFRQHDYRLKQADSKSLASRHGIA